MKFKRKGESFLSSNSSFFFSPVSSTLEKLEIAESEFTHVSVWDMGEVNAFKGIKWITDGMEQEVNWQD